MEPLVLGIETSCDDTAAALVDGDGRVVASVVASQLAAHQPFGGVVPEIASREHLSNWTAVSATLLERSGVDLRDVDVVAATRGPGLIGSLLVGLSLGRSMAYALDRPFHAVHHLEGHLFSPFLLEDAQPAVEIPSRFAGLVVSGGHTSLYSFAGGAVETLAETRDDAMGEVFDKVGKRLGLPYPQGPRVDELAERGEAGPFRFSIARCTDESLDFSYSGLKSQTLLAIESLARETAVDLSQEGAEPPKALLDLLAGFRKSAVDQLLDRVERHRKERAAEGDPLSILAVSGGAAANRLLRREIQAWGEAQGVDVRLVPLVYSGDNAAMIAFAALRRHRMGQRDDVLNVAAASRLTLS